MGRRGRRGKLAAIGGCSDEDEEKIAGLNVLRAMDEREEVTPTGKLRVWTRKGEDALPP
jgi:hypothetical protein